jgi:hypothetical protein
MIERTVALAEGDCIELDDLPPQVRGPFAQVLWPSVAESQSLRVWGSRYARLVFERCGRNKRDACRVLDISYHTLEAYLRHTDHRQRPPLARRLPTWVQSISDPAGVQESGQ